MKTTFRYLFVHASFLAHVTVIVTVTVHQQTLGPALYQQQLLATATAIGVVVSQREPFLSRMAEVGRTSLMTHEVQDPEGGHPHQEGEEVVDEGVEVVVEGVMGEGGHHLGVVKQLYFCKSKNDKLINANVMIKLTQPKNMYTKNIISLIICNINLKNRMIENM